MGNVKVFIQKWVAISILLVIILGQYAITGYLATSYAIDLLATQSENVQFRAYFKNGEEEITEVQSSIDAKNLKLKIDVAVKNEGYFNGQISLANAGFVLDEATANNYINKVENNVIYLNQINVEETASIEVGIKYFEEDKIQASTLNQITTVKLNGTYISSRGNTTIDAGSDVKVTWNIPENTKAELASKLQTNSIYSVNEQNKKIVQYLVSSKLTNNAYPVKNTNITANIPIGATNVEVHKRTTKSTNGEQEFTTANYTVENNVLTINVNNTEIDGKISWMRDVQDIFVITYEYPENTNLSSQTITINGKITTQNDVEINAEQISLTLNEAKDGIASVSKLQGENNIYKGKIYSAEGRDITSYSIVYVEYVEGIKDIEITENASKFIKEIENNGETTTQENNANVNIKSVKINKGRIESVLGSNWVLTIGETTITNETQADENGDIIINLNNDIQAVTIKTSKPVNNGSFVIETTKRILKGEYTRAQLKEFTKLKDSSSIKYTKNNNDIFTFTSSYNIGLKDTESKASIQSEQTALIAGTTQPLNLTVVLESKGENQDLYKNPHIRIKLPSQVQNVTYTQIPQLMFENGLELTNGNYKVIEENGQKVLDIQLTGEQISYLGEAIQGTSITINTNVQIAQTSANENEEIVMTYTNENATRYTDNGTERVNIQIATSQTQGENVGNGSQEAGSQEQGNQAQSGNEGGNSGSGTQNDNNGIVGENGNQEGNNDQPNTQGDNVQNQVQGTVGQLKYSVSAKVGGEAIQEGDVVKAGEIIEYTVKLENPTTEDIEGINISATVPENTTLMVKDQNYPEYNPEDGTNSTDGFPIISSTDTEVNNGSMTVEKGQTREFKYMLKINLDITESKEIKTIVTINNKTVSIKNIAEKANIEAKIKPLYRNSDTPLRYGYTYMYKMDIINHTNEEQRNVQVTLNKNEMVNYLKMEYNPKGDMITINETSFTIDSIGANNSMSVIIYAGINNISNITNSAEMYCIVKDNQDNIYRTNLLVDKIGGVFAEISLNSLAVTRSNNNYLEKGDELLYEIKVKNIGTEKAETLYVEDLLSELIELEEVKLNKNKVEYLLYTNHEEENSKYNKIVINKELEQGEEAIINIKGKLKANTTENAIEIANKASVFNEIKLAETEKNIYYLNPTHETNNEEQNNGNNQDENNNGEDNNNGGNNTDTSTDINNESNSSNSSISGLAWLDNNNDGERDPEEDLLEGINVILYDIENNKEVNKTTTESNGTYTFANIDKGNYVIIFEYNTEKYNLTTYQSEGVNSSNNSDVKMVTLNLNDENQKVSATNVLTINESSIKNIDIGLVEAKKFDLSLSKTISRVSVTNLGGNKSIDYSDTNLAKVEIKGKYLKGSVVVVEYKIRVTNKGELAGYVKKIVDNKPSDLKFNSKLNSDWYQSDNVLYNTSLSNEIIEPGETKELTLILTKTMTNSNTGLTSNKAEILEYYNSQGIVDESSSKDDDISQADLIISVSTGIVVKFTLITLVITLIIATAVWILCRKLFIKL